MSGLRPVSLYGLEVPPGDEPVPAFAMGQYPGTFKLTMAALNPFEKPIVNETADAEASFIGATLRIIRVPEDESDDEDDDEDDFDMAGLLDGVSSEDEDDEDVNGGPSDPEKSNKARRMAMLKEALAESGEMELDSPKLSAKEKGKAKAIDMVDMVDDEEDDEDDDEDEEDFDGPEEFVLCTLDPSKNYQQTLDITINEHEMVYFQVSGTHTIYLTGNILIPDEEDMDDSEDEFDEDEDDEDEYDLTPDDDELEMPDSEDESDELDDMEDPRVTELDSEEEAPKLIKAQAGKGKNKRPAPESEDNSMVDDKAATLDDIIAKSLKPEDATATNGEKLSKKQKKKLKANGGNAVDAPVAASKEDVGTKAEDTIKPSPGKADKKVQFSKTLIQGPTPSGTSSDASKAKNAEAPKATEGASAKGGLGVKTVQGVTLDDKKVGSGPAAKKGDKVSMRYIGKLADSKKVFDANKKGKPFTFQLGAGSVIKGWDIGIQGMTVGGERRLTIPAHLAYGSKSMPDIPANSTLVFDVKLLEIK